MSLRTLYTYIDSSKDIVVRCPICFESMTFGHYYHTHALKEHSLKNRKECVFCMGFQSWPHGHRMKRENVQHVLECLKRFVNPPKNASLRINNDEMDEDICDCHHFVSTPRDMLGRFRDANNTILYESLFEKPEMWKSDGVTFTESSGLGQDVYGIIQRYRKKDLNWFHIMVKHDAFPLFYREMKTIQHEIVVLPFWCLCDGLMAGGARVQHRHMILACELEGQFESVWTKKMRYPIPNSGRAKKRIKIESVFHLVRTIVYVSRQRASCDGRILKNLKDSNKTSHFYINRPMHEHSIAFLCTLFPGGIEKLLLEQNGSKKVMDWEEAAVRKRDLNHHLKWGVPIKVIGWKHLYCTIPLDRRFKPTEEETPLYLILYNDKKMYLKERNLGDREECCSLRCLRDEMYTLSPAQQKTMNEIKTVKNKAITERNFYWQNKLAVCFVERDVMRKEMAYLTARQQK